MGHILFGLPEIQHFHLHSRVARKLASREHRVTVLCGDPVSFEFFCHQGLACLDLKPEPLPSDHLVPIQEFAAVDCRLQGIRDPNRRQIGRAVQRLEQRVSGMLRLFQKDPPDLVMMHGGRSGMHRLLHFVATQFGATVLHTGEGLLPMTLQVDGAGIDGDANFARATAQDYRQTPIDDEFLAAATAAWLGRAFPPPLARLGVVAPPLHRRLSSAAQAMWRGDWARARTGIASWQEAYQIRWPVAGESPDLPRSPFACLLLQDPGDPRVRLDASSQVAPEQFVHSAWQALQRVEPDAKLVVVGPDGGSGGGSAGCAPRPPAGQSAWPDSIRFVDGNAAAVAVAMAMAVITVNHPLALAALLAGTPVLHTARTPYGIPGIAFRTDGSNIADHLALALGNEPQPALRRRFLTKILREHHIWCPPNAPDSNGVAGIVRRIEAAIDSVKANDRPLRYRAGPVWPLAVPDKKRKPKR